MFYLGIYKEKLKKNLYDHENIFLNETMKLKTFEVNLEEFNYVHVEKKYQHHRARRASGA